MRAADYELPERVSSAIHCIFGLHGVPLPPRIANAGQAAVPADLPPSPPIAKVTPTVLAATYSVVKSGRPKAPANRQAVAEFQKQYMNKGDLATFFTNEVPDFAPGDDAVSKFVGAPYKAGSGVEALLDVQYIMGNTAGVQTEFWEWPEIDFCGDLHNYTLALLAASSPPLSNSISYGWQGSLDQIGCSGHEAAAVDINWAKLAARGISVIISSGDSGSGCITTMCDLASVRRGYEICQGTVLSQSRQPDATQCCERSSTEGGKAFTWYAPENSTATETVRHRLARRRSRIVADASEPKAQLETAFAALPALPTTIFAHSPFHCGISGESHTFPERSVYHLNGNLTARQPPGGTQRSQRQRHVCRHSDELRTATP